MEKQKQIAVALAGLLLVGAVAYLLLFSAKQQSILGVSEIVDTNNQGYLVVTKTISAADDVVLSKGQKMVGANGTTYTSDNTVEIKTIPLSVEYRASLNAVPFLNQEAGGRLQMSTLAPPFKSDSGLTPYTFTSGVVVVNYEVLVYENNVLVDNKTVSFNGPSDSQLSTNQISLAGGRVQLTNVAVLSDGMTPPELSNVLVFLDNNDGLARYPTASALMFFDSSKFTPQKYYKCASVLASDCLKEVRTQARKSSPFDNSPPAGYETGFSSFTYSSAGGVWTLPARYHVLATFGFSESAYNIVKFGLNVAKPTIVSSNFDSSVSEGKFGKACLVVRNAGPDGEITFSATNSQGWLGSSAADSATVSAGQSTTFCSSISVPAGMAGRQWAGKLTACGVSQFSQASCVSADYSGTAVAASVGAGSDLPTTEGTHLDCRTYGPNFYYDANYAQNNGCRAGIDPLVWVAIAIVIAGVGIAVFARKGGRKR